ncbi:MAG TPA: hypothetical protein VMU72_08080 [Gaiellaceae bacterium]|nr:hypothetical protein [Gaiellaceae bacterium]
MREPRAPVALIHGEIFEPRLNVVRERRGVAIGIVEDEHPHAARLAIAHGREPDFPRSCRGPTQRRDDRVELLHRAMSEKGERDVKVIAREDPHTSQLGALPLLDLVESVAREAKREE